ncbi:FG-GAP-like repeat-containing protein [Streptomyces sp. NPDC021224]|uniref:FG-GAP-like repeat-containing protein n=1 Tax=unclassified Streptomyces TaxID=2593676 RepID=UPI0037ADA52A
MRTSIRTALIATAAIFGLAAGGVSPAYAATGYDRCPKGKFCVFDGAEGQGAMTSYSAPQPNLGSWSTRVSSVYNHTGYQYACLYNQENYQYEYTNTKDIQVILSGASSKMTLSYATTDGRLNNSLRSFRWAHTGRKCVGQPEPFLWSAPYGIPSGVAAQTFGDLDGDGTSDLLNRTYSGRLWFLRGDEKGRLIGSGWNAMTVLTRHGDLNGDNTEDLLARDTSGKLWMYPGNGKGAFNTRKLIGGGWNTMTRIQAMGDLNGDGKGDLVSRDTSGKLWMYPGNGKGAFNTRKLIGGGWNTMQAFAAPGDFNGDTHSDLIVSDTAGRLWLYPGNGKSAFGSRTMIGTRGWTPYTTLLGVGNFPTTPYPDLLAAQDVTAEDIEGTVRIYDGLSGGRLGSGSAEGYLDYGDGLF